MRLTDNQHLGIITAFQGVFAATDHLWLFGSRTDDTRRGGDIDLYIETQEVDYDIVLQKKLKFLGALKRAIGERKIDVVIKQPHKNLDIHEEARRTGILLI